MANSFDISALDWQSVRPDVAQGVFGKTLCDGKVKVVLTRVAPGGKFVPHRDKYGHLLFFQNGKGFVRVDGKRIDVRPGIVVQIAAGEEHEYGNTGNEDLVLISLNIPG